MAKCNWDPSKHEGRPCPIHGSGMWDENILTRKDKIEKLKEKGYTQEEIEEELKDEKFDDEYDFEEEFDSDEFINTLDETNYEKAEKNESKNADKSKSQTRKDKYGNPLVSDEAFKVGQKGAKAYLDYMTQHYDLNKLKHSNIFLGGLQTAVSKALIESGYDKDLDTTYQDFNEIIGSVLGEEVNLEDYERNATRGFTGKKYIGYTPKTNNFDSDEETKTPPSI